MIGSFCVDALLDAFRSVNRLCILRHVLRGHTAHIRTYAGYLTRVITHRVVHRDTPHFVKTAEMAADSAYFYFM